MKATVADHVTRRQFRQALSTAGVELPAHQMELIYEKFDDSNDLSINYVAFTRAVDPAVSAAAEGGTLGAARASPSGRLAWGRAPARCRLSVATARSTLTPYHACRRRPPFRRAARVQETYSDRPTEPSQRFTDGYLKPRVVLPTAQQATRIFG